ATLKRRFQHRDIPSPKLIIMMDPPDQARMRVLGSRGFTPRAIANLEPTVRGIVTSFFDRAKLPHIDIVDDWSSRFPVEIISTMLGVPEENRQQIKPSLDRSLTRQPGE